VPLDIYKEKLVIKRVEIIKIITADKKSILIFLNATLHESLAFSGSLSTILLINSFTKKFSLELSTLFSNSQVLRLKKLIIE
jgi:hypothetical protein